MKSGSILVTGGAGFIGSHLVERLLAGGEAVVVIDDCSTGTWENLNQCKDNSRLHCVEARLSECSQLPELAAGAKAIYHLAAAVGVELVVKSPIRTIQTNLRETEAILEVASRFLAPILIASTSEVYGKSLKPEFTEDDDLLIGPPFLGRWCYACSKLMDEFMALAYAKERRLPVRIARLFNTVGPRQTGRYGMVLPRFIAAAKAGRPLQVHGDGLQTRCFCHVGDTVEALLRLQNSPRATGEVFNVGATDEISILDLARLVIAVLGSTSAIELVPYEKAYAAGFQDMVRRKPSVDKLANWVGFRPSTALESIIRDTASGL